jgi:hypothetical protein
MAKNKVNPRPSPHGPERTELLERRDPVAYDVAARRTKVWRRVERILDRGRLEQNQLRAAEIFLARIDPIPKDAINVQVPIVVMWRDPPSTSSSSPLQARSSGSSTGSDASTSSSAIAPSAKRFWQ